MTLAGLLALALLLAGWVGYPVFLSLGRLRTLRPDLAGESGLPPVAVIIATREEPAVVEARVADLARSDYPAGRLEVVVAVDAGAGRDLDDYEALGAMPVPTRVVRGDAPGGKAAALNAGVRAATTLWVGFADSAQRWRPDALRQLVGFAIANAAGGASGDIETADSGILRPFWQYERGLRRLESTRRGLVNVTGAIHVLRRDLWVPLPAGLILDDQLVPLRAARAGAGSIFCEEAVAIDPRRFRRMEQFQRKVRTLTGVLQVCVWEPWVLHPGRNPLWAEFVGHKLLRIATPYLALVVGWWIVTVLPAGVVLGTAAAGLLGLVAVTRRSPARVLVELFWTGAMLAAPVAASWNALRGRWSVWQGPLEVKRVEE